ncbi:heat-inducible transcriptional repressor HrcA [Dethiothermospora halolimnae]|uniref:heat-inducible transcriptional repressor HrcA n=1 Tax=Dethiothermospora halolimnae TaxID=3114390 RepID=UPI003CCBEB6C
MKLDDRKLKVLQAVIHSYITSAEPIGSRTVSKKYNLGVSSATIRNEMSDLEDLGFLLQPYTSAGRIPSDKAYRLYVDNLMKSSEIVLKKRKDIKKDLLTEINEVDKVLQNAAKILSKVTNYTSLAIAPQVKQSKLKRIELIPIDDFRVLVVIVNESDVVKNTMLRVEENLSENQLTRISKYLNQKLKGKPIESLYKEVESGLIKEMYNYKRTIESLIPLVNQSLDNIKKETIYSEGVTNIFNFPEYNNISKAKSFISFIENKSSLLDILLNDGFDDIQIKIGKENCYDEIKECSLITATYRVNGKTIGKIGVIGPTRMEYSKVISTVKSIAMDLGDIITDNFTK